VRKDNDELYIEHRFSADVSSYFVKSAEKPLSSYRRKFILPQQFIPSDIKQILSVNCSKTWVIFDEFDFLFDKYSFL
jgi:hypothetical protein